MISPNSSNRNVTITIFTTNSSPAAPANPTSESISPLDRITMQILTRLLTTRIVANRYSSADSNRRIALLLRSGLFFSRTTSRGEREKKAVSEAETDAETPSNRIHDQQDHGILQRKRVERHGLDKTRCQNYRYLAGPIHNRNGLVKQRTALPLVALLCGIVFQHDPRTAVTFRRSVFDELDIPTNEGGTVLQFFDIDIGTFVLLGFDGRLRNRRAERFGLRSRRNRDGTVRHDPAGGIGLPPGAADTGRTDGSCGTNAGFSAGSATRQPVRRQPHRSPTRRERSPCEANPCNPAEANS